MIDNSGISSKIALRWPPALVRFVFTKQIKVFHKVIVFHLFLFDVAAESAAMDTVQNCIRSLTQMKILDATTENNTRYIQLSDAADTKERTEQLLELLDACKLSNML